MSCSRSAATLAVGLTLWAGPADAFLVPSGRQLQTSSSRPHDGRSGMRSMTRPRMAAEPTTEELHTAVRHLSEQVQQLTAIVRELASQSASTAAVGAPASVAKPASTVNGATVNAPPAKASKKDSAAEALVPVSDAYARISSWAQETGGAAVAAPTNNVHTTLEPPPSVPASAVTVAPEAPPAGAEPPKGSELGYTINIDWDGKQHTIQCDGSTTVLDAAMDAGLDLPHSCMSGSCLTCPGKLTSGTVDQSEGILEEDQIKKGFMLTCVSYPTSDLQLEIIHEDDLE